MVTEALQFGWQVRDGCQRQRRSKEGYFGGRLQGPILMKAANIWLLDWIDEFFSIAQKEAFFLGGAKIAAERKNHCQNGSLLVDYTLEEIRGKADIKKLNCNIGVECAVILSFGGILDPSKTLVETLVKLVICWFANHPSLSMNLAKNSPRGMDLLAEAFRQREVDDAAAMACHVTISPLGLPWSLDNSDCSGSRWVFRNLESLVPTVGRTAIKKTCQMTAGRMGWWWHDATLMQHWCNIDATSFTCCDLAQA